MSIYPVYLPSWFPKITKRNRPENKDEAKELAYQHTVAKVIVKYSDCKTCGGKCTWKKSWGHHSIPWGYGDVWCSKKCLKGRK